jgi:uncharacterized protein YegJ (DUF2314 family)
MSEPEKESAPSPFSILLFDKLPKVDADRIAATISAIEPLNGSVSVEVEAESKDGFVAYVSFGDHRVQLVGLNAPVPEGTIQHTIPCSQFKPDLTKPMSKHRTQVVCYYHGTNADMTERLVALHKIAQAFLNAGLLGTLDPDAWNCMPRMVVEKVTPTMLRACMEAEPLNFWIGFIKFIEDQSSVWFCTKGAHRFGLPDFACHGPLCDAKGVNERFNRLFCYLRKWNVTPQAGDTAEIGANEYVLFREVYERSEFLTGPAGTLVIEETSEAEARTGGPSGAGKMMELQDRAVLIDHDDPVMVGVIAFARESLGHFWQVFEKRENGEDSFSLKVRIIDENSREFFWLVDLKRKDGQIFGTIDNDPNFVKNVLGGQRIPVPEGDIVDWMYNRAGKMVGNFSLRVLARQMAPEQAQMYLRKLSDLVPLKVQCSCGQKLSFEVEAVGGKMPWPLKCPTCGADDTAIANEMLSRVFVAGTAPKLSLPIASTPSVTVPPLLPPQSAPPRAAAVAPVQRPVDRRTTASEAITSLVCALLILPLGLLGAFVHFPLTWLSAIPGILAGHSAISAIRADRRLKGMVIAIIGLALCYLNVAALTARVVYHFASGEKGWGSISVRSGSPQYNPTPPAPPFQSNPPRNTRSTTAPPPAPAEPRVTTDPTKVEIAESPVSGTIGGQSITLDRAVIQTGFLKLSKGIEMVPDFSVMIPLQLKWGESIAGKKYLITSFATVPPAISLRWKEKDRLGVDSLYRNYVMRLEFGEPVGGRISGKIYLESGANQKTKLEGTFQAQMK